MDINFERLIELSYEIEGLLLLAQQKGDNTPLQLWQLISSKAQEIHEATYHPEKPAQETSESVVLSSNMPEELPSPDINPQALDMQAIETTGQTPEIEISTENNQAQPAFSDNYNSELEIEESAGTAEEVPIHSNINSDDSDITDSSRNFPDQTEPIIDDIDDNSETYQSFENEKIYINGLQSDLCDDCENDDSESKPLTLDEKLAREQTRNLKKAFSLNDRFRFRRELFGNSDSEFADAINMVEAMESLTEANEYFYDDLQWDPENPEVIDFMQIITKHFQSR